MNFFFIFLTHVEGEVLHIGLNGGIVEFSADESFGIENGVRWVHGDLIFGGISDKTLAVGKGYIRWGGSVTL